MTRSAGGDVSVLKANTLPERSFTLPILGAAGEDIGRLVCVDRARAVDPVLIEDLTAWRRRYAKFFLTQFEPSPERTSAWLEKVVLPAPDRILFTIEKEDRERVGHIGVCDIEAARAELDNLVRGRKGGDARLIFFAEIAILRWLFLSLGKSTVTLHVFSNNRPTIALHSSVGFRLQVQQALTRTVDGTGTVYRVEAERGETVDFQYDEMRLSRDDFLRLHPVAEDRQGA